MIPPPTWSPSSRCEEIQLQPPEIWSPDPCQPHSHDFLTDAIVRKMSRMFCQAARGREVTCATFLCLYLHRPEIRFWREDWGLRWSRLQVGHLGLQASLLS